MDSIKSFAPTATLLFFAIIYFGTMIDVGLFDPMIRFILRAVRNDPVRLVVLTAVLVGLVLQLAEAVPRVLVGAR